MAQTDDEIIKEALERFAECQDAENDDRERMREELKFAAGEQWPEAVKSARENDPNGARPCLTMDKLGQYVRQVVNDSRQNKPAIKVRPVDSGADIEVADILQGVCRHIEDSSRADIAYDTAIDSAAKIGVGYFRIATKVVNEETNEQEIDIVPIHNIFAVHLDPSRRMPDGSDAEFGFITDRMRRSRFQREYPKAEKSAGWVESDHVSGWEEKDSIQVAEYFRVATQQRNILVLTNGVEIEEEKYWEEYAQDEARPIVVDNRTEKTKCVEWYKLTSKEVLDKTIIPCEYIPIVEVIGNEHWIDGERHLTGMIYWGKDAQRAYNYARSAFVEQISLAPKAPFIAAAGQIEGFEDQWRRANVANQSVLTYDPIDVNGNVLPPPQRQMPPQPSAGWSAEMQVSESDIQSALGMYKASLGAPSNEKSGKAILARQQEGDTSTFHYIDNLSRSIRHAGRILVSMIPAVYDTRRVVRIIGLDGESSQAVIDPQAPQPIAKVRDGSGKVRKIFNPTLGTYDVTVTVGPSYNTRRQEAAESMVELTRANPALAGLIGDLMVKAMDWPDADIIARRLKTMLPPQIQQAEDNEDVSPEVSQAVAQVKAQYEQQIGQMIPQVQAMQQQLQQLQAEKQQLEQVANGKVVEAQVKGAEIQAKQQESETSAQLQAAELQLKARELTIKEQEAETKRIAEQNRQLELLIQAQNPQPVEQPEKPEEPEEKDDSTMLAIQSLTQQVQSLQQTMMLMIASKVGQSEAKQMVIKTPSGAEYRGVVSES